jgi:protein-L-isoaspartate O-methyltransferase
VTLSDEYFEHVYAANEDPWNFGSSSYEAAKYARTLAALPRPRHRRALEVGCSIGVLSGLLASRTGTLLSLDVNDQALARARARNAAQSNVTFERRRLPDELPDGPFDLVVLSEVLYYLSPDDLERALDALLTRTESGGTLILVHWTPRVHDYPQTGDAVHEAAFRRTEASGDQPAALRHRHGERHGDEHEGYRLDVFERV